MAAKGSRFQPQKCVKRSPIVDATVENPVWGSVASFANRKNQCRPRTPSRVPGRLEWAFCVLLLRSSELSLNNPNLGRLQKRCGRTRPGTQVRRVRNTSVPSVYAAVRVPQHGFEARFGPWTQT